jgi:cell wall-associated NlpC family hydrolase
MKRLLTAAVLIAAAAAVVPQALASGVAEVRDGAGHLLATAGAGTFATAYDAGWTLRFDSATRSTRGVELRGVSVAGGHVYANRIFVPAHGLRGARVEGLEVGGHLLAGTPNRLVPLGPRSYLVVLQEAVVPGEGSGVVGLRIVSGDSSLGLDPGTQLLIGFARAAQPAAQKPRQERLAWLALGVSGHGANTGEQGAFPELMAVPSSGPRGSRAVAIAERYLGVPYLWGGADPLTGFDCSGLAMYVYAQLGVSLTHYTGAQWYEGTRVPPSQLEPGDLVFFEPSSRGPQHEGIYIGNGQFIQAPHTGDVVKISSLDQPSYRFGYVGAVRPWTG